MAATGNLQRGHRSPVSRSGSDREVLLLIGEMIFKAGAESRRTALQALKKRIRETLRRTAAHRDVLADEWLRRGRW